MHESGRYSLMPKLIGLFLLALIPLVLLYLSAHATSRNLLLNEVIASNTQQNKIFTERLSEEMQRIVATNAMLISNWELGKLAVAPQNFTPFTQLQAYSNIQDKIYLAQLSSRFIGAINIYLPGLDKCITTNNSGTVLNSMRTLSKNIGDILCDQFILHNGQIMLVSQNTFPINSSEPSLLIQTVLDLHNMGNLLSANDSNELIGQAVLFTLTDRNLLSGSDNSAVLIMEALSERLPDDAQRDSVTRTLSLTLLGHDYRVSYSYLPNGGIVAARYFDQADISVGFSQMQNFLWIFALVLAAMFILIYFSLSRMVNTPLKRLLSAFQTLETGDLDTAIEINGMGEFHFIYQGFNKMVNRLKQLINQTYQQKILMQRAELKQLQAQIDPHFLYNGFFILNKRIRAKDTEGALDFSQALSTYFRYVTQNAQDVVLLIDEVEHAYNFARIQQVRFPNRLHLAFEELPERYAQIATPRLILQPVIENVFKHVLDKQRKQLTLFISYVDEAPYLRLMVEDNGSFFSQDSFERLQAALNAPDMGQEISGLVNVHRRLQLFYGEECGLIVSHSPKGGLCVSLRLMERKENDPNAKTVDR